MLLGRAPRKPGTGAAEGCQRRGKGGKAENEFAVVVGEADEAAHIGARRGRGPLRDGGDLAGINGNAALGDNVAEEADGGAAELAFGRLGVELVVPQRLQDHAHVHQVLLARFREDKDVITVDFHEAPQHGLGRTGGPSRGPRPTGRVEGEDGAAEDAMHVSHQDR